MKEALNVAVRGHGPEVVFMHPVGLDGTTWEAVAARFDARFKIVLVDLPGHGRSPRLPPGASIPDYAEAVVTTLDVLGIERPIVVGGSFGGMIALTLGLNHPDRVRALVISACPHGTPPADRAMVARRGEDARAGGMDSVVEATLARWFTPGFRNSATVRDYRERLLADDVEGWAAGWAAIAQFDVRARLPDLRVPTLCVAGAEDVSARLPVMQEMAAEIPGARITVVENGPHMVHVERPDAFADAIGAFLTEQAGR